MATTAVSARTELHGWSAGLLENGLIRLIAVPEIGGRVMAYDLGAHPFLFVDPDLAGKLFSAEQNQGDGSLAAWKNYGGDKTWPAPQGWQRDDQWHGPPDPVLDSGRYTLDELTSDGERASLCMTSPPDARTGIQISRRFTLHAGSSRVALALTFRNIAEHPVRWSIWDVVQICAHRTLANGARTFDPTCTVTTRLNPTSRHPRGFHVMFGAEDNPQWQTEAGLFRADYRWEIGKVGIDTPCGWIAFSQGSHGVAFAERFAYDPTGDYPDDGSTVECWTIGAGQVANLNYAESGIHLMETEVLSPLHTIAPGKTASFELEWGSCHCAGPVLDVTDGGCIATSLSATTDGDTIHLRGEFGVFDAGLLELSWLDADDRTLRREPLGPVDPLTAVQVERTLPAPHGTQSVVLHVVAAKAADPHWLAAAKLDKES